MANCPYCSRPLLLEGAPFCSSCGRALPAGQAASVPEPSAASPAPGAAPAAAKTSGMAVASLILSFFSLFLFPGVLAIVFGHVSRSNIKKSAGKLKGEGVALVGLILGYLGVAAIPFVLIIAAIAIPNLLRSRQAANQASAVGSLRTINTAEITYISTYPAGFSPDLASLAGTATPPTQTAAGLIDQVLASGHKSGYVFTYQVTARDAKGVATAYSVNADPAQTGTIGQNHFFTDESGVIRMDRERPATKDSPPLE